MIEKILIAAFFSTALWLCYRPGMIFSPVRKWVPKKLKHPLVNCMCCMAPWYGVPILSLLYGFSFENIIAAMCAIGVNLLTGTLIDIKNLIDQHVNGQY